MNDDIRIALAVGKMKYHDFGSGMQLAFVYGNVIAPMQPDMEDQVPNYCSDLNAMHEAEKTLKADRETGTGGWSSYNVWLQHISDRDGKPKWHLNARQRAEALVKTLNL